MSEKRDVLIETGMYEVGYREYDDKIEAMLSLGWVIASKHIYHSPETGTPWLIIRWQKLVTSEQPKVKAYKFTLTGGDNDA